MKYYSALTKGFYTDEVHTKEQIPSDAVEITEELYTSVFAGQAAGKIIQADAKGYPEAVDTPEPTTEEKNRINNVNIQRQIDDLDAKSTRSVRAILSGTATDADKAYLADIEKQVQKLRSKKV